MSVAPESVEVESGKQLSAAAQVGLRSIVASIFSTFLLRVGSRGSFVILGFYLGEHFESATVVAIVIEAFYISELLLAPVIGVMSDRKGRKPFMLMAPAIGGAAALVLMTAAFLFPAPKPDVFDLELVSLLLVILAGRLLEGVATAFNAPANLGYITDATVGDDKLRVRVMTGYEVATVAGIALGIPFGGFIWKNLGLGRAGFLAVVVVYAFCFCLIYFFMRESLQRTQNTENHGTWSESRKVLSEKRVFTFVPAWLSIMALLGAWIGLILIILTYPVKDANGVALAGSANADNRFPGQLLYGGFDKGTASLLVGGYGLLFIVGMGLWNLVFNRFRRTTIMLIGIVGSLIACGTLSIINSLGDDPVNISTDKYPMIGLLLFFAVVGVLVQSGFTPAALTHLAAISETLPGKRGAVMGLYSVLLGIGQLVGTWLGGIAVDLGGFYGLMIYSLILTIISASSVWYMRSHNHDIDDHLPAGRSTSGH
ncbi:MAG: MFS transporter [Chloroflexota bacterium]|nr:MFS transporter [Chloroflexota bacterium]